MLDIQIKQILGEYNFQLIVAQNRINALEEEIKLLKEKYESERTESEKVG